jgi:hypothetical protein
MRSRSLAVLILWLAGAAAVSAQQPPAYSTQSIAGALQPGDGAPAVSAGLKEILGLRQTLESSSFRPPCFGFSLR